jgi:hypothetical protein
MSMILEAVKKDYPEKIPFRSLLIRSPDSGDSIDAVPKTNAFGRQLALAALRSDEWDKKKGQLKDRKAKQNEFVLKLANDGQFLKSFINVFSEHSLRASLSDFEHLRVLRVADFPAPVSAELKAAGARSQDKLPFKAVYWLALEPLPTQKQ